MESHLQNTIYSVVALLIFGFTTLLCVIKGCERINDALRERTTLILHYLKLGEGIVLFGICPLLFSWHEYGYLQLPQLYPKLLALLFVVAACIVAISNYLGGQQIVNSMSDHSLGSLMTLYFPLRINFLVSYELFFRGLFLFTLIRQCGMVTGVLINVIVYALLHAGSGRKKFIGAIPFGILLSIITIQSESVWPAVVLHLLLALSYEIPIIKKNYVNSENMVR